MLNGTFRDHVGVEQALRDFYDMSGAIVFSTGYMANLGMISTLAGKGEYVILDADSHASIYDGCKQGVAEIVRFRHNDVADLDSAGAMREFIAGLIDTGEGTVRVHYLPGRSEEHTSELQALMRHSYADFCL